MLRYRSVLPSGESIAVPGIDAEEKVWLESLFHAHYERVVSVLIRMVGDRSRAEEIAADVFCKASAAGAQAEATVPWIYRVAANAGLDAVREQTRRRTAALPEAGASFRAEDDALEALIREERRMRVRLVLAKLKPRDAELLLLRAEGLSYRELAEVLGVRSGSVGTLLARAEAEFEKRYRAAYGDPAGNAGKKATRLRLAVAVMVAVALGAWLIVKERQPREEPQSAIPVASAPGPAMRAVPESDALTARKAEPKRAAYRKRKRVVPKDVEAFVALDDEPIEAGYVVRVLLGAEETPADVLMTPDGRIHGVRMVRTGSERKGDAL